MPSKLMTSPYRTRDRLELCPVRQEPSVNARIIAANTEVIEDCYDELQPSSITRFDGVMTVLGYRLDLRIDHQSGRVINNEDSQANLSHARVIVGVTLVHEEYDEKEDVTSVFCEIQHMDERVSKRAAANLHAAVQRAEF